MRRLQAQIPTWQRQGTLEKAVSNSISHHVLLADRPSKLPLLPSYWLYFGRDSQKKNVEKIHCVIIGDHGLAENNWLAIPPLTRSFEKIEKILTWHHLSLLASFSNHLSYYRSRKFVSDWERRCAVRSFWVENSTACFLRYNLVVAKIFVWVPWLVFFQN